MKRYLIEATIQGSERMFVKTEQELYSSLNWKDGKLRWGSSLFNDVSMEEDVFKRNIENLLGLIKQFGEVEYINVF